MYSTSGQRSMSLGHIIVSNKFCTVILKMDILLYSKITNTVRFFMNLEAKITTLDAYDKGYQQFSFTLKKVIKEVSKQKFDNDEVRKKIRKIVIENTASSSDLNEESLFNLSNRLLSLFPTIKGGQEGKQEFETNLNNIDTLSPIEDHPKKRNGKRLN